MPVGAIASHAKHIKHPWALYQDSFPAASRSSPIALKLNEAGLANLELCCVMLDPDIAPDASKMK